MHSGHSSLLLLAEAVADGEQIDWDHAESSAESAEERRVVQQLRQLATVSQTLRAQLLSWGRLEVREEIGRGTFGTVYRAWDNRLEREVALKLLRASSPNDVASAVIKEGQLLARIRHHNVVIVHGADVFEDRVGIWMEFVSGRTLKAILDEHGPFGPHEAALIGRDLCRALAAVHQQGFVHRDVKAQNVMREAGGRTVLMDFGAGVAQPAAGSGAPSLGGTPLYLAPEVLCGGPPSVGSDLYSLGVLLFHLVSREFPVSGASLLEMSSRHAAGARRLLRDVRPDLPASFVRAVDSAVSPDPAQRPRSAGAMEALLDEALLENVGPRPSRRWRHLTMAAAVLAVIAAGFVWRDRLPGRVQVATSRNSVAIMPFRNLSEVEGTNQYLSDGVTEDLVAHLGALGNLRVISGASMQKLGREGKTEQEIGNELGVAAVLRGSFRQSGDRVRIVSELVDANTGEQLWSEGFDRELKDVFTMQAEVARKIAVALKGELTVREREQLGRTRPRDYRAYGAYWKGRYYWGLRTEDDLNRSVQFFTEALTLDPAFAPAYAGLADSYTALGTYGILPRREAFGRAAIAARRAVELDDSLAEGHAALGYALKNRFEWSAAEASFQHAIALKASWATAHHWYSILLTQRGRLPEAITEAKAAISLDPLAVGPNMQFAAALLMARRFDDAVKQYERALQIDPGQTNAYRSIAQVRTYQGEYEKANEAMERALRAVPAGTEDQELKAAQGYLYARMNRGDNARRIADELASRYKLAGEELAGSIASIYVALGSVDTAFEWLRRAVSTHDVEVGYLKVDPRWDPVRGDPRFEALLDQLDLRQ
jgi:eukaryotic-like serine/threonine-protein kinase